MLSGRISQADIQRIAVEVLSNPVIQRYAIDELIEPPFFAYREVDDAVEQILLRGASDAMLQDISTQRRLALDLTEMQAIPDLFST